MSASNGRSSFSARVFRIFALTFLVFSCLFTLLLVVYQGRAMRQDLREKGRTLAAVLARGARTAVFAENRELLAEAVQGVLERDYVLSVTIYAHDLRTLVFEGKGREGARQADGPPAAVRAAVAGLDAPAGCRFVEDGDALAVVCPVTLRFARGGGADLYFEPRGAPGAEETIGWVEVALDTATLRSGLSRMSLRLALALLGFLLAGAGLVFWLARRATQPLALLSEEVRALGRGEPVTQVPVRTGDEIGRLAGTFNDMLASLKEREREKEHLEERLRQAQTMEAVGTLARGISHDFNNILSTVKGAVHILEKRYADDGFLLRYTGKIRAVSARAGELIEGLLAFSRTRKAENRPLDLNELVTGLEPTLRDLAGESVHLRLALAPEPLPVLGDPLGLKQLLLNLVANARDAMPEGGLIEVSTGKAEGAQARIAVADSGAGIEPAARERIFEPFFSTKEVGRGTGLGLSIVHGIVEQHRGRIGVKSQRGCGTVIEVFLPLLEGGGAAAEAAR